MYPSDPVAFAQTCLNLHPDPVQASLLQLNPHRCILNCCRQWGKSTITVVKALHLALLSPRSLIILLSPTAHQSGEFIEKASHFLGELDVKVRGDGRNKMSIRLPNGSRIVGLPGKRGNVRCFSAVSLLLIDEASWVEDAHYRAVRPMLAASNGQLWIISTPNTRSGFFFETWTRADPAWTRISIPAHQCPRISTEFLEEERRLMPASHFRREYLCEFTDDDDAVYSSQEVAGFITTNPSLRLHSNLVPPSTYYRLPLTPLIELAANLPKPAGPPRYFIGVDLGQKRDYTAISIIERAEVITGPKDPVHYQHPTRITYTVRHLERIALGTPYPDIVAHVCALVRHPALGDYKALIVDGTGVGQPVVDLFRRQKPGCPFYPVTITGGDSSHSSGGIYYVPRNTLLTQLEISLTQGQLKICGELKETETLLGELLGLRQGSRVTRTHDDLVFAAALANWRATLGSA
ncbi:MAG: terminase family protein [Bryobacteraceae bacterium]|nr:terminase family protein [Bryobacteraceae bacterium]